MFDNAQTVEGHFAGRRAEHYDFKRRDTGEQVKGSKLFVYIASDDLETRELRLQDAADYERTLGWKLGQRVKVVVETRAYQNRLEYRVRSIDAA